MSAMLPLSISTRCMLNSSILSIITSRSLWGCLIPRVSFSEKTMSSLLYLGVFEGGNHGYTLFNSLTYAFFSGLEDPPITNPPKIIFIFPIGALSPLSLSPFPSLPSVVFCMALFFVQNFAIFSWRISVSTWSFRCLHSSMQCPWS